MADRGIPRRVTYREVDEGYFDKRGLQRHAGVWSLWALGVAAVISGDFFGWNFGLDFGVRRSARRHDRHHGHVLRPVLLDRGDVARAAAHRRRVLVRAAPRWARGAGSSPASPRTSSTSSRPPSSSSASAATWGAIVNDLFGLTLAQPIWWLIFYAIFVGLNIIGVERDVPVLGRHLHCSRWRSSPCSAIGALTKLDFTDLCDRRRAAALVPRRRAGHLLRAAVRDLVLPRDRGVAAGRGGVDTTPSATSRAARCRGLFTLVVTGFLIAVPQRRDRAGRRRGRRLGRAAARRASRRSSASGTSASLLGAGRRHRPGRQLPHDHLRLRPEHLLAVAGRLLPALDVGHPRHPEDPYVALLFGAVHRVRPGVDSVRVRRAAASARPC